MAKNPTKSEKIGFILSMRGLRDPLIKMDQGYYQHLHKIYDDIPIKEIDAEFNFYKSDSYDHG